MIVVIEGCDATGKSTLAKEISTWFPSEVHHSTVRKWAARHHMGRLRNVFTDIVAKQPSKVHIFDRLWPSECVYGTIFRGAPYDQTIAWMLDWIIGELGGVYIWCKDDTERTVARHKKTSQERKEHFEDVRMVSDTYNTAIDGALRDPAFGYLTELSKQGPFMGLPNHFVHHFGAPIEGVIHYLQNQYQTPVVTRSQISVNWDKTNK